MNIGMTLSILVAVLSVIVAAIGVFVAYKTKQQGELQLRQQADQHRQQLNRAEQQAEQQRLANERNQAANFLRKVADALDQMTKAYRDGSIPTRDGNYFKKSLKGYDQRLGPYLNDDTQDTLRQLEALRDRAIEEDDNYEAAFEQQWKGERTGKQYDEDFELNTEETEELLADMQRMVAELRSQADDIEMPPTTPPENVGRE